MESLQKVDAGDGIEVASGASIGPWAIDFGPWDFGRMHRRHRANVRQIGTWLRFAFLMNGAAEQVAGCIGGFEGARMQSVWMGHSGAFWGI
jgi:hypothetical protein